MQETEYDRRQKMNRSQIQKSEEVRCEVFILCGVVTVTFRVLSLFVVMKCFGYSKIVLKLIVVPPGECSVNRFT
jgi:nitrate reductase NapE component